MNWLAWFIVEFCGLENKMRINSVWHQDAIHCTLYSFTKFQCSINHYIYNIIYYTLLYIILYFIFIINMNIFSCINIKIVPLCHYNNYSSLHFKCDQWKQLKLFTAPWIQFVRFNLYFMCNIIIYCRINSELSARHFDRVIDIMQS